ncbi:MAG: deoxynucleoside kinase [Anaerolineae bacterium]|nr:deoxynucleoside kinase [Anaerolineae bacterium]
MQGKRGKSTLTTMLADYFAWEPFYEANAENPYLADFYDDMTRWSFHSQVFFLGKRLEHHRLLIDHPGSVVQDRTVYEDAEIFARNLYQQGKMTDRDYDAYRNLYKAISSFLPPPSLLLYLDCSVDTLVSHIQNRGRDFEQNISRDYLAQLNHLYNDWIDDWTACPILRLKMDAMDFQHNTTDFETIIKQVKATLSPA